MPLLSEKDFDRIRQIVREEVALALGTKQVVAKAETAVSQEVGIGSVLRQCPATKGNLVCTKTVHRGRHAFRPKPHEAPPSKWKSVPEVKIKGSGSRHYIIAVGNPVKVLGFGKRTSKNPLGAAEAGWTVSKIEVNIDQSHDVNVTINKRGENTRVVKLDKIVYVRPKREAA